MVNKPEALTISIGVLGGIDTYLTATVIPVPVWVTFIAWASFFAAGGGTQGFLRSVACNLTGIVIASLTLLTVAMLSDHPLIAALCVGIGSAAMVQASKTPFIAMTPGIVFGFASTVGTTAATGYPITTVGLDNPALIAASAMVLGGAFGYVSEAFADLLVTKAATVTGTEGPSA